MTLLTCKKSHNGSDDSFMKFFTLGFWVIYTSIVKISTLNCWHLSVLFSQKWIEKQLVWYVFCEFTILECEPPKLKCNLDTMLMVLNIQLLRFLLLTLLRDLHTGFFLFFFTYSAMTKLLKTNEESSWSVDSLMKYITLGFWAVCHFSSFFVRRFFLYHLVF